MEILLYVAVIAALAFVAYKMLTRTTVTLPEELPTVTETPSLEPREVVIIEVGNMSVAEAEKKVEEVAKKVSKKAPAKKAEPKEKAEPKKAKAPKVAADKPADKPVVKKAKKPSMKIVK